MFDLMLEWHYVWQLPKSDVSEAWLYSVLCRSATCDCTLFTGTICLWGCGRCKTMWKSGYRWGQELVFVATVVSSVGFGVHSAVHCSIFEGVLFNWMAKKVCASLEQILCVLFQLHIHVHMKRLCSVEWQKKLFTSFEQLLCVLFQKKIFFRT